MVSDSCQVLGDSKRCFLIFISRRNPSDLGMVNGVLHNPERIRGVDDVANN